MPKQPIQFKVDPESGCFVLLSHFGGVHIDGKTTPVPKHIYQQCFGEVPEDMRVTRKCGNTKCINPEHLTLATTASIAKKHAKPLRKTKPLEFVVDEDTGCFLVTSHSTDTQGYPVVKFHGVRQNAHRFVYEQCFGEIPPEMVVRHKCDNPRCVNPEHLELGTQYENIQDRVKRGRSAHLKGELNGHAKLTEDDVRYIKNALARGETMTSLAKQFNVSVTAIFLIKKGRNWSHLS